MSTRARIDESFKRDENVVTHTTNVLESECPKSQWYILRLPYPSKKECQALQANTGHPCWAKVGKNTHGTLAPTYIGMKKEYRSNNHILTYFWFFADDINRCVKGSKKKWVFDWPNLPKVWPVKVNTNLTREEVFALEDVGFQLQQKEALSPRRWLRTMTNLPILCPHFYAFPNRDAHPNTWFSKAIR